MVPTCKLYVGLHVAIWFHDLHHSIVTGSGGSDQEEDHESVELPQMGLLVPDDLFESWGLGLRDLDGNSIAGGSL